MRFLVLSIRSPDEEVVVIAEAQPLPSLDGYDSGLIVHSRVLKVGWAEYIVGQMLKFVS